MGEGSWSKRESAGGAHWVATSACRSAFALVLLVIGCGGSSRNDDGSSGGAGGTSNAGSAGRGGTGNSGSTGKGGGSAADASSGGDRAGTSGDTAVGLGGSGALGGESGTFGGGPLGGTGADGGSFGGATGGDFGTGAVGGSPTCEPPNCVCGPGGCTAGDPNVTPIEPPGPVLCGGVACANRESCCLATGECFDATKNPQACAAPPDDADPLGRKACSSNAQCDAGWFCSVESGLCQGTGHCQPIGNCGTCEDGGSGACRLCGCDGNTYPNVQTACRAGTFGIYSGGGCGETIMTGGGGAGAGGAAGSAGASGNGADPITPCGSSADCTQEGAACCAISGRCYPTSDPAQCAVPPPGTRFPCSSNAQCYDWELCQGDGCGGPGGCVSRSGKGDCGIVLEPVCGCDGVSYTSADCAAQRGVRVASAGACTH